MNLLLKTFTLLLVFSLGYVQTTFAQENNRNREIGLYLSNLDNFGFVYKKQLKENKFLRIRSTAFNLGFSNKNFSGSVGLAIGIEKRKAITDKLKFVHGFEPALSLGFTTNTEQDRSALTINPSLGYVLGIQYDISERFYVSLESIPAIRGSFSATANNGVTRWNSAINFGFNSAAAITVAYRF